MCFNNTFVLASSDTSIGNFTAIKEIIAIHDVSLKEDELVYLKSASGESRYFYVPFENAGYLIYDLVNKVVVEFSVESNNKFIAAAPNINNIYYVGPLGYYTMQNQSVVSLTTRKVIGSIKDLYNIEIGTIYNEEIRTRATRANGWATISGTVPNYNYNAGDTCGSTAAAMWLK